jgi:chaperonin cofactor prefoldin
MKDELLTLQSQYAELNQSLFKVVEQKYQLQLQLEEWQVRCEM